MKVISRQWRSFSKWLIAKRDSYLQKRLPSKNVVKLNINNTFILPSSFGWSSLGIVVCLFILGTNFQNNIILLLCYFLLAMVLLAIFHSYFFFVQHQITFLTITPDFENRHPFLPIQINSTLDYKGGMLNFTVNDVITLIDLGDSESQSIKIALGKYTRGYYKCPKIKLQSSYGFGLFTCWTYLRPKINFYVYPAMQKSALTLFRANANAQLAHASDSQYVISDDLQGIREHLLTDPIHHISWKHVAKGQGMLSKDFSENKGVSGWLRLQDLQHFSTEQALKCLCYQIQQLDRDQVQFGLDLGATKVLPQEGQAHLHNCLELLALYKVPANKLSSDSNAETKKEHTFDTVNGS